MQNRRHIDTIVGHTLQSIIRRIVEKLHDGVCEYGHHFTVFGSGLPFIDDQCPLLKVLGFKPSTNHVAINLKSAEALFLEACRATAENPSSPILGEGFTPPLPLPARPGSSGCSPFGTNQVFQNQIKTEGFCKANLIYYDNVDQFWHVDSCWSPLALYCPSKNLLKT